MSAERNDVFTWNSVSPRVGIVWKLNESGHTVLKAHAGRILPRNRHRRVRQYVTVGHAAVSLRVRFGRQPGQLRAGLGQHEPVGRPELQEPLHGPVHRRVRARAREESRRDGELHTNGEKTTAAGATPPARMCPFVYLDDTGPSRPTRRSRCSSLRAIRTSVGFSLRTRTHVQPLQGTDHPGDEADVGQLAGNVLGRFLEVDRAHRFEPCGADGAQTGTAAHSVRTRTTS